MSSIYYNQDPYSTLGIAMVHPDTGKRRKASQVPFEEIKVALKESLEPVHATRAEAINKGLTKDAYHAFTHAAEEQAKRINGAYDVLKTTASRTKYDSYHEELHATIGDKVSAAVTKMRNGLFGRSKKSEVVAEPWHAMGGPVEPILTHQSDIAEVVVKEAAHAKGVSVIPIAAIVAGSLGAAYVASRASMPGTRIATPAFQQGLAEPQAGLQK